MRPIDADALLKNWERDRDMMLDADYFIFTTVHAPTIDALPRWIPCEERLPREKEVVLITNSKGNVRCGQFRGTHGKYWFWKGNTLEMVEAWMPLPEPYMGEGKDDE